MLTSSEKRERDRPWLESYAKMDGSTPSWSRHGMPFLFEKFLLVRKDAAVHGVHLDVGCGDGVKTINFVANGLPTLGIDISEDGIKKARGLAREREVSCDFVVAEATTLNPLVRESIGSLSDILVGTHFKQKEWNVYMSQLKRILQLGAPLLFVFFSNKDEHFHGHPVSNEYTFDIQEADPGLEPDIENFRHYHGMYNKHFGLGDIIERIGSNFGIIETEEVQHPNYSYRRLWNVIAQKM